MSRLIVDPRYDSLVGHLGWDSVACVLRTFLPSGELSSRRVTIRAQNLESGESWPVPVFFKRYGFSPPSWRFWFRRSKAEREYQSYGAFEGLGILCASRIAWGEERDRLGRLCHAFIVTRTVPHALTLLEFIRQHHPTRKTREDRAARGQLWLQLAAMVRAIHAGGFYHNDLYWRNVLVEVSPGQAPKLWWLDCPRGRFDAWSPWREHRRLKDLATLDVAAADLCSRSERVTFLKTYLNVLTLDRAGKQLARRIVSYRMRRWPKRNGQTRR